MKRLTPDPKTLAVVAASTVGLVAFSTAPAPAIAATIAPAIAHFHNATYRTLTISNRVRLLRAHPGAKVSYRWQTKKNSKWLIVKGADRSSFTLPVRLEPDTVRVLVTLRVGRSHLALASNTSKPAPAPATDAATPSVNAGTLPLPYVPSSWSGPNPPRNCGSSPNDESVSDTNSILINMDYCGATLEGLAPLTLPNNWTALTDTQRGFVLLNLERIERGETPFLGESTTLDGYAMQGAEANTDPTPPDNADWSGSNWFGGTDSTDAVQGYVFDDGPGSGNLACSDGVTWGCWGHRDNILDDATETNLAAGLADGPNGDSTMVFGYTYTDFNFSWAAEVAAGYPPGLPDSFKLAPAEITQVRPNGNSAIAFTGSNLDTITGVWFANIADRKNWSCSTPNSCSIAIPKGLSPNTTYDVYLLNPAGLSARTLDGSYTTGL
jgi:hypothetical protein